MKFNNCLTFLTLVVCVSLLSTHALAGKGRRGGSDGGGKGRGHGKGKGKDKSKCECPTGQEAVEVYSGATTGSTKRTECIPIRKQACYKICASNPCDTSQPLPVTCVFVDTFTGDNKKPGTCPTIAGPCELKDTNGQDCTDDSSCDGEKRCCPLTTSTGTIMRCVQPVGTFAAGVDCGSCPDSSESCKSGAPTCTAVTNPLTEHESCPVGTKCCACSGGFNCKKLE